MKSSWDLSKDTSMDASYGGGGFDVEDVDRGRSGRDSSGLTTLNFFSFAVMGAFSADEFGDVPGVVWASTDDVFVVEESEEREDVEGAWGILGGDKRAKSAVCMSSVPIDLFCAREACARERPEPPECLG